jgi:hypothetical protein
MGVPGDPSKQQRRSRVQQPSLHYVWLHTRFSPWARAATSLCLPVPVPLSRDYAQEITINSDKSQPHFTRSSSQVSDRSGPHIAAPAYLNAWYSQSPD